MSVLAGAAAAGLCAALLCGPSPRRVLRGRLRHGPLGRPVFTARPRRWPPRGLLLLAVAAGAGMVVVLGLPGVLLTASVALVVGGVAWLHTSARQRRHVAAARRRTIEACDALVAELRAGQPASQAVGRAAEHHPVLVPASHACGLGADVAAALRQVGTAGGGDGMSTVAAAWQVAETSGSGLVPALERVAQGLRADDATRAEVAAALEPARATARLLAVLPAFGLLLGAGLGGDPLGLLLGTPGGNALLLAGVALALAGTVWVERLTGRAES